MKKFVIALLVLISILAIILLVKMNQNTPVSPLNLAESSATNQSESPTTAPVFFAYSSDEIKDLVLKGQKTLECADNIYFEEHNKTLLRKYYYTKTKQKSESFSIKDGTETRLLTTIKDLNTQTEVWFEHPSKTKSIHKVTYSDIALQSVLINVLESRYRVEFVYMKEERLEKKDCIVFKAFRYEPKTNELKTYSRGKVEAYWIEKETGFLVGIGEIQPEGTSATADVIMKNLSFGTVKDSDFIEPSL